MDRILSWNIIKAMIRDDITAHGIDASSARKRYRKDIGDA
jgi:hypothetical protein